MLDVVDERRCLLLHLRDVSLAQFAGRLLSAVILCMVALSLPAFIHLRGVLLLALDENLLQVSDALVDHALFVLHLGGLRSKWTFSRTDAPTTWHSVGH